MGIFALPSLGGPAWPTVGVLDIGAMPEGAPRFQGLIDLGLAEVTCFEPQEEQRAKLAAAPGRRRVLPYFLGDGGPATFHVTRYAGCSSLLEPDPAVIDLFCWIGATKPDDNFTVVAREPVATRRLDDLADCPRPDYVKIDVQGAELMVLRHGTRTIADATVIECEVEFLALYKGQPVFAEVQQFMAAEGFVLHKLWDIVGRNFAPLCLADPGAAFGQALWADAIFVRDFTRPGGYSDVQLLKTALVMHEVYRSYDFVLWLLREHDRRTRGKLAPAYYAALQREANLPVQFLTFKKQG